MALEQNGFAEVTLPLVDPRSVLTETEPNASRVGYLRTLARAKALLLPLGAPGDLPPCIRQRPLAIAGDRQGLPFLVFAPHRALRCIARGLCVGLFIPFCRPPRPPKFLPDS